VADKPMIRVDFKHESKAGLDAWCTGARHVIHRTAYRCSPRHPPHRVPVLATSSTAPRTGARHVIHRTAYRCSPRHPSRFSTRIYRVKRRLITWRVFMFHLAPLEGFQR